jgi:hypothetical protein
MMIYHKFTHSFILPSPFNNRASFLIVQLFCHVSLLMRHECCLRIKSQRLIFILLLRKTFTQSINGLDEFSNIPFAELWELPSCFKDELSCFSSLEVILIFTPAIVQALFFFTYLLHFFPTLTRSAPALSVWE